MDYTNLSHFTEKEGVCCKRVWKQKVLLEYSIKIYNAWYLKILILG